MIPFGDDFSAESLWITKNKPGSTSAAVIQSDGKVWYQDASTFRTTIGAQEAGSYQLSRSVNIGNGNYGAGYIKFATITIPGGTLAGWHAKWSFDGREINGRLGSRLLLTFSVRRASNNSFDARLYCTETGDTLSDTISVRTNDGITWDFYVDATSGGYCSFYAVTPEYNSMPNVSSTFVASASMPTYSTVIEASRYGYAHRLVNTRTLTIGNTGKTFDGSANVSWSLAEIGAATSSHNHTLDSLSNVTITSNAAGEILKWSGTAWVNNTLAEAGIQPAGSYASATHSHTISDVANLQTALNAKEPALGNPATNGRVLSSTTAGVRSWVPLPTIPVTSVFGRTGAVVAASGDYTTAQVTESGNLYYTDARARAAISASAPLSYSGGVVSHLATDGNLHVPATSTTNNGKALVAGSTAGSIAWTSLAISHITSLQTTLDAKMASASYPDLVAIEALAGTSGLLRKTATNTWSLDTNAYLTGNQTITLSGDVSGSGSTSISVTNTKINVTEHSSNNTEYPVVWDNTSRALYHTAAKLKFNPSSGLLSSTAFSSALNSTTLASFVGNWASPGYWGFAGSTDADSSIIRAVICSNLQGAISSAASLSVDKLYTSNDGNGTNIRIGNDLWLGDINDANTMSARGVSDPTVGYIRFGTDSNGFGYNGSRLYYGGAAEIAGMAYASGGFTVPQAVNSHFGASQIARMTDYVGMWGFSATWQFGRGNTVFSSLHTVTATFNEGIDVLGTSYFATANVNNLVAPGLSMTPTSSSLVGDGYTTLNLRAGTTTLPTPTVGRVLFLFAEQGPNGTLAITAPSGYDIHYRSSGTSTTVVAGGTSLAFNSSCGIAIGCPVYNSNPVWRLIW